ncbi:MAG: hypothetical protein RIE08_12495 [Acidimicrobiales bacterium]
MNSGDLPLDATSVDMARRPAAVSLNGFVLEGLCDVDALADAVTAIQDDRPELRSRLVDAGTLVSKGYAWRPGAPAEPRIVDLGDLDDFGRDYSAVIDRIFDRQCTWDLRTHRPFEVTIARLSGEKTFLSLDLHHAVGDAETNFSCVKAILAGYHLRVTGTNPEWARRDSLASTAGTARAKAASFTTVVKYLREFAQTYPADRLTRAHGTSGAQRERIAARVTIDDPEIQRTIRERARAQGATITDLTLAATMRAIATWNRSNGADVDVQRGAIAVNRRSAGGRGNNEISMVVAASLSRDLDDRDALMGNLAAQRIHGLELGIDGGLANALRNVTTLSTLRPLHVIAERRAASRTGPPGTAMLTNVGVLWPEIVDGRPTARSFLAEAGGLRLVDIVVVPNLDSSGALMLIPMTFNGRFQVVVAGNTARIRQEELNALTDLVADEIVAYA